MPDPTRETTQTKEGAMTEELYWHFLTQEGNLRYEPFTKVEAGQTLTVTGKLVLCEHGLHASSRAIDALQYAPGPIVCRVTLGPKVIDGGDKVVAKSRTVLWMADATETLHEFACWTAEQALALVKSRGEEVDPRSVAAIAAKRRWLRGEITDDELAAARDAARAAACAAAWGAAWTAAWDAAWTAAWDAAWDAAWTAAWAAARDAQNDELERRLLALEPAAVPS